MLMVIVRVIIIIIINNNNNNKCVYRTDTNPPFAFDISPFFSPPRGAANPQKGRRHIRNQSTPLRPHAKCGMNRTAGCREIVDKKSEQKTYSKTNTSPFALTSEWRVIIIRLISVFLIIIIIIIIMPFV